MTLIHRFGSALNLSINFHMLFLHGVYATTARRRPQIVPVPSIADLVALVQSISRSVGRRLERWGLLLHDAKNAYLEWDSGRPSSMDDLAGHAISYRVVVGPTAAGGPSLCRPGGPSRRIRPGRSWWPAQQRSSSTPASLPTR